VTDIYFALAVMLVVCIAVFVGGRVVAKRATKRASITTMVVTLVALLLFIKFVWDAPILAKLIPLSSVIVLGNFQPPLSAFLAGLASVLIPGGKARRIMFVAPLLAVSLWRGYGRLFEATPPTRERWKGDVCRQTTDATCSAAACATLLRAHGIASSETEMAELSLTRRDGTTVLGRYRGLVLKTSDTPWRVEPIVNADLTKLRALAEQPVVISVGLPSDAMGKTDSRYIDKYGWQPGLRHTVVLFGFSENNQVDIGDPSVGRERWDVDDLKVLWQGNGYRLIPREQ